jgi:two-component system, response regulator PdtaR
VTNGLFSAPIVLIVEDNAVLSLLMVGLVEKAGYKAIQASNASEALAILECRMDVALLVTNVAMRGSMNGVELAHAVEKFWPSVKIIVASGQPGLLESDLPAKSIFFAKPYHDDEMIFEIRSLLGV